MKQLTIFLLGILSVISTFQPASAQDWGRIQGTVYVSARTEVATDATVTLVGLNYSTRVDESGQYIFDEVPAGSVLLRVESPLWGRNSETILVVAGETVEVDIEVIMHLQLEELIITAGPTTLTRSELVNPINVLSGSDLLETDGVSLGEALKNQPGMASTYYGPGASRPIIGGVGGSRVKILQHGLDVGDVSDQSEDHAVVADALDVKRVEIIRGPAALLYGSEITGGVVNILGGQIPNERPVSRIEGVLMARGGLGSSERGGGGRLTGAFGNVVWNANGLFRETGDVSTPMFNPEGIHEEHEGEHDDHGESEHDDHDEGEHDDHDEDEHDEHGEDEHDEDHGDEVLVDHIENSGTSLSRGSFGMSYVGRRGFIGAAISFHNSDYGVPGGHMHGHGDEHDEHGHDDHDEHDHEDHDEDDHEDHDEDDHEDHDEHGHGEAGEEISIDLNSISYGVGGEYRFTNEAIHGLRFRFGLVDYKHSELENFESGLTEIGIVYENNQLEGRIELDHSLHKMTRGVVGVQIKRRDLSSVSDHSSLPTTLTNDIGIFAMERVDLGEFNLEFSGRMQWQSHDPDEKLDRSFSAVSLGAGINYQASEQLAFSLSLARAAKLPSVTELYSDGLHTAVRSVERGNENLEVETTNNATFSSYVHSNRVQVTLTGYLNQSDNFIYLAPTGEFEEENPILQAAQSEVLIAGVELDADVELFHSDNTHIKLGLTGDYISGQLTSDDGYLPRIPPFRVGASLQYSLDNFVANLAVKRVGKQDQVFSITEDETDGYTMLSLKLGYRFIFGSVAQSIALQGLNLTNTLARSHTSLLKDTVPLPGRDIRLTYTIHF